MIETSKRLDNDGCIQITPPQGSYKVTLRSRGAVNGIKIRSYTDWDNDEKMTGNYQFASQTWKLNS